MKPHTTSPHFESPGALRPVKKYAAPGYPTLLQARKNPALLEKLPSRWQENARVAACLGMLGTVALAGCDNQNKPDANGKAGIVKNVVGDNLARVKMHGGGQGSSFYVVYLTEQEAYSTLQAEAKAAGLYMNEEPFVEYRPFSREIAERHKNAYEVWPDRNNHNLFRAFYFRERLNLSPLRSAFRENWKAHENNEAPDGLLWGDFLRLFKEQMKFATVKLHHGGEGGSFYVVYLTEPEMYSIIQAEAKAAGLQLSEESFVEYERGTDAIIKHHKNAFKIQADRSNNDAWRLMHHTGGSEKGSPLEKAFHESWYGDVFWEQFLWLLEKKDDQKDDDEEILWEL